MFVYAGIDEAGYGPLLGPLVIGRSVITIPKLNHDAPTPDLWLRLGKAVCRRLSDKAGRIAVNDSKKLTTKAAGVKHLELGCLAFTALDQSHDQPPQTLGAWLDRLILGSSHLWSQSKTWDPEGLLSTLPAIASGISGMLAGHWLRTGRGPYHKATGLLAAGGQFFGQVDHQLF